MFFGLFRSLISLFTGQIASYNQSFGNNNYQENGSIFGNGFNNFDDSGLDTFEHSKNKKISDDIELDKDTDDTPKNNKKCTTVRKKQEAFLKMVNNFRQRNGLRPLKLNDKLSNGSMWWAKVMSHGRGMVHSNLSSVGQNGHFNGFVNSENIAAGQRNIKEAFIAWINSPGHRANILNPDANVLGIGFDKGYWCMNTAVDRSKKC